MSVDLPVSLTVTCSGCGFLGGYLITLSQHREGALARAERLKQGHRCPEDPTRTRVEVVTIHGA